MSLEEKAMRHKRTKPKTNMKKFYKHKREKNEAAREMRDYRTR